MKRIFMILAVGAFLAMAVSSVYAYTAHYGPTETIYYDAEKAFNGYNLFTPLGTTTTYLIDMEGNIVHTWSIPQGHRISLHQYFMDNGNLLRSIRSLSGSVVDGTKIHNQGDGIVQELDWDGNILWQAASYPLGRGQHHDFHRIWNKKLQAYTTLMIAAKTLPEADAIALGANPAKLGTAGRNGFPDGIIEVDMNGNLIWEWHLIDHTVQDFDPSKANYGVVAEHPEKQDINYGRGLGDGDWQHLNSMDYNEELDHVVCNGRTFSEFYVIDHGKTFIAGDPAGSIAKAKGPDGDLIFRWGNPEVYDQGINWTKVDDVYTPGDQQMWVAHNIQWIDKGLPGEGHFLIYDNGAFRGWEQHTYSEVLEIDPYGADGSYVPMVEAGYTMRGGLKKSNQIVWSYKSISPTSFYSWYISGMERLPNGNTVVCSGAHGHFFEVTATGEVVWEYINPAATTGTFKVMPDNAGSFNNVFRFHRYSPDHPALLGRDLTPKGKITELVLGPFQNELNQWRNRK